MTDDENKPKLDPVFTKLGRAVLAKTVAVAASRGMPVTIGGQPVDPALLHRQANQGLLEGAAELTSRAMQTAAEHVTTRIQEAGSRQQATPTVEIASPAVPARRPFGTNRKRRRR
jgi:hypothetical protein